MRLPDLSAFRSSSQVAAIGSLSMLALPNGRF